MKRVSYDTINIFEVQEGFGLKLRTNRRKRTDLQGGTDGMFRRLPL